MGILVDVVSVQAVNKLLELGVIEDLASNPGGVARVVGKLDRVDRVDLEVSITPKFMGISMAVLPRGGSLCLLALCVMVLEG